MCVQEEFDEDGLPIKKVRDPTLKAMAGMSKVRASCVPQARDTSGIALALSCVLVRPMFSWVLLLFLPGAVSYHVRLLRALSKCDSIATAYLFA